MSLEKGLYTVKEPGKNLVYTKIHGSTQFYTDFFSGDLQY